MKEIKSTLYKNKARNLLIKNLEDFLYEEKILIECLNPWFKTLIKHRKESRIKKPWDINFMYNTAKEIRRNYAKIQDVIAINIVKKNIDLLKNRNRKEL